MIDTYDTRLVWLAIGTGLALLAYVLAAPTTPTGAATDDASGKLRVCIFESILCVGMCAGLPVLSRELALGAGRAWQALARNVFAIYVFHFPFVLLLQWVLIDAPMPKLMRLLLTVIGAILGTFAFTNWIVLRLPLARRISDEISGPPRLTCARLNSSPIRRRWYYSNPDWIHRS